jgi:phasin family protein
MTVLEPEEYVDNYKSGFKALFALMKPAVEGVHAAAVLNVQATRAAWTECGCALQAALQSCAQLDLGNWQVGATRQTAQMAASYSHQLFEIAASTQAEWVKVAQAQYERINQRVRKLSAGTAIPRKATQEAITRQR